MLESDTSLPPDSAQRNISATDFCIFSHANPHLDYGIFHVKARTAITLVVADDKFELRKLIRLTFAGDDCRIVEADNGEDAIRLIQSEKPQAALIDIMMPGIDGLEVCRRVRADAAVAATRLILVTARGQQTDVLEGLKAGADDYIIKPFSPENLRQRILSNLGPRCA